LADTFAPTPAAPGSSETDPGALQPIDIGRDIVFTATIEVEVDDVAAAGRDALAAVEGVGGMLFGQRTSTDGSPRTVLVFKVPPAEFQTAVDRLGALGRLRSQDISADDVTERVVDLESRIITAQASVDRLRSILESATNLSDIATLESQLLQRETDLELLRGQLRTVQGQVDLATITVTLTPRVPGPAVALETTFYVGHDDGAACPGRNDLMVDEGDQVTVCFVVTNVGDTALDEIEVSDPGFDLGPADIVRRSPGVDPVAPGTRIVFSADIEGVETASSGSRVTARPVDEAGNDLGLADVVAAGDARLTVEPDTALPGFLDGFGAGWDVLRRLLAAVVVGAGFLVPFAWVPVVVVLFWRFVARRRRGDDVPLVSSEPAAPPTPRPETEMVGAVGSRDA
jgi:hypothetical protein